MKTSYLLAAATLSACATAKPHHGHEAYHNQVRAPVLEQRNSNASCGCATSYTTFYGEATLIQDIQSNTTTVQHLATSHVQITVEPVPATTATTESPIEVTSPTVHPYTHAESSHPTPSTSSEIQAYSPHPSPSTSSEIQAYSPLPSPSTSSKIQAYSPHPSPSSSSIETPVEVSHFVMPYHSASSPAPYHASSPASYQVPSSSPQSLPAVAHSSPKPKPKPKPAHTSPALGSSGSQWCMTYSPYTASGDCKSASAISTDIASIAAKGFSSIRLYSTDCSGLASVGSAASSHGLKLILGIFISDTGIPEAETQIDDITSWATGGNWQDVEMIVVGNEAVFNGYCTATALAAFISKCKSAFKAAGYTGPVTTTEPINILQEEASTLCPALDVAAANIHPFFNADVSASDAGPFVAKELAILESICPGLQAYNLETGWPSAGDTNGAACPGVEEQKTAIESIKEHVGGKCAFFSFEDDLWKAEGEFAVEQSWGCSQLFGD